MALSLFRDVRITGSPAGASRYEGSNSTVFIAGMDEGGWRLRYRQNLMYKSLDGGVTFYSLPWVRASNRSATRCAAATLLRAGEPHHPPHGMGRTRSGSERGGSPRHARARATDSDPGNIYYVRSTDNGVTWSGSQERSTSESRMLKFKEPSGCRRFPPMRAGWCKFLLVRSLRTRLRLARTLLMPGCNYQRVARQSKDNGLTFGGADSHQRDH